MSSSSQQDEEEQDLEDGLQCEVCFQQVSVEAPSCAGANHEFHHYLCNECFCTYASTACEATTGVFERTVTNSDRVSHAGELPCFLFATGNCTCASIPATTIARALSTNPDSLDRYHASQNRVHAVQVEQELRRQQQDQQQNQETTSVDRLRNVVMEALNRGGGVACPNCTVRAQKNDACMHMTCVCGTRYCYCCGRRQGNGVGRCPRNGAGCDSTSAFLESQPGWERFAIRNETPGMGALHEFHKRRMMHNLRQVKERASVQDWNELMRLHPNILQDVPTVGRYIDWNEINQATPPVFGHTRQDVLCWINDGNEVSEVLLQQHDEQQDQQDNNRRQPNQHEQQEEEEDELVTAKQYLSDNPCIVFVWMVTLLIAVIVLVVRKTTTDNPGLFVFGNLLISILATTGFTAVSLHVIDANQRECSEVQCFGRRGARYQPSYLAINGRWKQWRWMYWLVFYGGISLGSLFVGIARNLVSQNDDAQGALKCIGTTILSVILFGYGGCTILVNKAPLPRTDQHDQMRRYRRLAILLMAYCAVFSLGVGLFATFQDESTTGTNAANCFLSLGATAVFAEMAPRDARDIASFPIHRYQVIRLAISYVFFVGIAIGSLMVGMSSSGTFGHGLGIAVLVVSLVGSPIALLMFGQE